MAKNAKAALSLSSTSASIFSSSVSLNPRHSELPRRVSSYSLYMSTKPFDLPEGTVLALKGPSLFIDKGSDRTYPPTPSPDCTHPARPRFEALFAKDGPIHSTTPWVLTIDKFLTGGSGALTQAYFATLRQAGGTRAFEVYFAIAKPSLLPTWSPEEATGHSTSPGLLLEKDYAFYSNYRALQGFELPHVYGLYRFNIPGEKHQCVGIITENISPLLMNPEDFNVTDKETKIDWELNNLKLNLPPETFAAMQLAYSRLQKRYLTCDPGALPCFSLPAMLNTSTSTDIHFIVAILPRKTYSIENVREIVRQALRDNQCVTGHEVRGRRRLYEDHFLELAIFVQLGMAGRDIVEAWTKGEWVKKKYGVSW